MLVLTKNLIVNVLGFLILLFLSACSSTPRLIEVSAKPVEKPALILPQADAVRARPISWHIITSENFNEVFEKLARTEKHVVLFGLTPDGYEDLALNLSDLRAYIQQQKEIIGAYNSYYVMSIESINEANKQIKDINIEANRVNDENKKSNKTFIEWIKGPN